MHHLKFLSFNKEIAGPGLTNVRRLYSYNYFECGSVTQE